MLEPELRRHFPGYLASAYTSSEELQGLVRWAYRKYYLRPRYLLRALWNCRRPSAVRDYRDAFVFWLGMMGRRGAAPAGWDDGAPGQPERGHRPGEAGQ